jgi:regulatory protein YycH of two-component signal transduction system YycFG
MGKTGPKIVLGLGVLLVMTLFLWGCTPNRESMGNTDSKLKESSMNLEKHTEKYSPVIPALDAAAPAVFETASFGLG